MYPAQFPFAFSTVVSFLSRPLCSRRILTSRESEDQLDSRRECCFPPERKGSRSWIAQLAKTHSARPRD
jgi:hypothetical protein